jgi:hypothetical protein
MKLVITESQYKTLITEYYDGDKLYDRERIVAKLKTSRNMREYIKKLPHIEVTDEQGNVKIATRIPEVVYVFLYGNY